MFDSEKVETPTSHPLDICPKCEGQTAYGPVPDGGSGLYCTRCDWQGLDGLQGFAAVKANREV